MSDQIKKIYEEVFNILGKDVKKAKKQLGYNNKSNYGVYYSRLALRTEDLNSPLSKIFSLFSSVAHELDSQEMGWFNKCRFNKNLIHFDGLYYDIFPETKIPKLAALYSGISIFTSPQFIIDTELESNLNDSLWIPQSFFDLIFGLKPLLLRGEAVVLPRRIILREGMVTMTGTDLIGKIEKYFNFEVPLGCELSLLGSKLPNEFLLLELPFIKGLDLKSLIDIRNKYFNEYSYFQHVFNNIMILHKDEPDEMKLKHLLREIDFFSSRLTRKYKEECKSLRLKGINVLLGFSLAIVPLFVNIPFQQVIAAIFGSKTVFELLSYINNLKNIKNKYSENPFWWPWIVNDKYIKKLGSNSTF